MAGSTGMSNSSSSGAGVAAAAAARGGLGGGAFVSGAAAEQVDAVLRLPELRYDPSSLTVLCHYVDEQLQRNIYDEDACTAVLQLYLLYPQCFAADVARKILIKGIMQLPGEDCALYIGMLQQQEKKKDWQPVQEILHLHDLLQQCRFKQVWEYLRESCMQDVAGVPGFADALRRYMCEVIASAYHVIALADLNLLLGFPSNSHELEKVILKNGWQLQEDSHAPSSQAKEMNRLVRLAPAAAKDEGAAGFAAASSHAAAGATLSSAAATATFARKNVEKYLAPDNLRACMTLFMR